MGELMGKMKNLTRKEAFEKSRKKANDVFFKTIAHTIADIGNSNKHKQAILFLDKNHPENAVNQSLECVRKSKASNVDVRILGLFSKSSNHIESSGKYFYPFSHAYPLTCMKRVISR